MKEFSFNKSDEKSTNSGSQLRRGGQVGADDRQSSEKNLGSWDLKPSRKSSKTKMRFSFSQLLILWLIFLLGINFFLYFNKRKAEYKSKKQQIVQLEQEIAKLKSKEIELSKESYNLKTREGIEKIARERLGLVKPDELPFVIVPSPKTADKGSSSYSSEPRKNENKWKKFLNYCRRVFRLKSKK